MKKCLWGTLIAFALSLSAYAGLGDSLKAAVKKEVDSAKESAVTICGKCGEVKGSENCCMEEADLCECGFQAGSPACCTGIPKGADVVLCPKCGEIPKGEKCCQTKGREKCPDCGFLAGSIGCKAKCG